MSKPKEAKETTNGRIYYNAQSPQSFSLKLEVNGRDIRVTHHLDALTDERYFELNDDLEQAAKRLKKVSTALYIPKEKLWQELVTSVEGYKPREDWKEKMDQGEAVQAVDLLLHCSILANDEMEKEGEELDYYDPEAPTEIQFQTIYGTALITLSHYFRQDTKKERDEFLAIETNAPVETQLASAVGSKQERLYQLGKRLLVNHEGYAEGTYPPAWHLAVTTEVFFARQLAKMGKSLTP
jgi:hypothetical protein